jgi:ribosomal protein S3
LRPGLQFCKRHVNTIYGVYGLKLWVFKKEPNI